jgi:hypothetical protein
MINLIYPKDFDKAGDERELQIEMMKSARYKKPVKLEKVVNKGL